MVNSLVLAATLALSGLAVQEPVADPRHRSDLERDVSIGSKASEEADKELKPTEDKALQERVDRIGAEIAAIARVNLFEVTYGDKRLNPFEYKFKVVKGEDVNAFCLPGGFVYVYEALVRYCESDDELAGVLAHEVSHAAFRHLATLEKDQSKLEAVTLPAILVGILLGSQGSQGVGNSAITAITLGNLVTTAKQSGWGMRAEIAADYGAMQILQKSRFSPVGAVTFMERLARDERSRPKIDWGIFRTHPPAKERVEALISRLGAANIPVRRSQVTTTFRTHAKELDGRVELWFGGHLLYTMAGPDAKARADQAVVTLNDFFDQVPNLYEVRVSGTDVLGGRRKLITVLESDAEAAQTTQKELAAATLQSVRGALYTLAYRIWG